MLQLVTRRGNEVDSKGPADKKGPEGWKRDGEVSLSGSMTRQVREACLCALSICRAIMTHLSPSRQSEQDWPLQDSASHITNIGKMIEEMEIKMRNLLQEVRCLSHLVRVCCYTDV